MDIINSELEFSHQPPCTRVFKVPYPQTTEFNTLLAFGVCFAFQITIFQGISRPKLCTHFLSLPFALYVGSIEWFLISLSLQQQMTCTNDKFHGMQYYHLLVYFVFVRCHSFLNTFFLELFTFTVITAMQTSWPNYYFIYLVLLQIHTSGLDLDLSHHPKGPKFQMNMDSKCYVLWLLKCHYAPTSLMCKGINFQKELKKM